MCRTGSDNLRSQDEAQLAKQHSGFPNRIVIALITFYRTAISPSLPRSCRFEPSCSAYALQAFRKYNVFKAFWLSFTRILRCNPFCKGGYDPLP